MKDNIDIEPTIKKGVYRHYKGNLYEVVGMACHSETLEWYVIYKPLYDHADMPNTWVRPYNMFTGNLLVNGEKVKRFTFIDKE